MSTLLRVLNLILMIPTLSIYYILYVFYPIIGYIIGRGFVNSIDTVIPVLDRIFRDPLGALKMPLHIYYILIKGDKNYGKEPEIIIHR